MNIKEIIKKGESETLEFKESLQLKDIIEAISAFSILKFLGLIDKKGAGRGTYYVIK